MNHAEAVRSKAVERYMLGELSPEQEDEFAAHYFECVDCARDIKITAQFIDTTKEILQSGLASEPQPARKWWRKAWPGWPPQYALAASGAFLAIILYQNLVMIPNLHKPIVPQALVFFSLGNTESRSADPSSVVPPEGKPFILLIDIPVRNDLSGYRCEILTQSGRKVLSVDVSDVLAQKTVPILIPASVFSAGGYVLTVSGRAREGQSSYIEIERHQFQVK